MGMFKPHWFRFSSSTLRSTTPPAHLDRRSEQPPIWVIHASETGAAEDLAAETCRRLRRMGRVTHRLPLDAVDPQQLSRCQQAFFLASTTGDGEPPNMADDFADRYMHTAAALSTLQFAVLALGDRRYDRFCAFGHQLHAWLLASGAQPWFDLLEMDDEDPAISEQWHSRLAAQLEPRFENQPELTP